MRQRRFSKKIILTLLAGAGLLFSCNKNDFLNKKPSSNLLIPTTLADFQALLDNDVVMQETPELGELSADNFYIDSANWRNNLDIKEQNAYVWAMDIYENQGGVQDWNDPYQQVFYANIVLEGLPGIAIDSIGKRKGLQGSAYFIRAYAFYNLAQIFAPVYNKITATSDLGIPLRVSSAINQISVRASVQSTYDTIISDLKAASGLLQQLPDPDHLNRPSKAADLAMLARVYLSMRNYDSAGLYADSCLKIDSTLINYNMVPINTIRPFASDNAEILYQSHLLTSSMALGALVYPCIIDSNLYQSYTDNDLRKKIFFYTVKPLVGNDTTFLNIGYSTTVHMFSGLATDEVYLIRAECSARLNNPAAAFADINTLLSNRWVSTTFSNYSGTSQEALDSILVERRKELIFRGLRWTDLRRLNLDGANITLTRFGKIDSLPPNDPRYVLPIPPDVPGITQNMR